MKKPDWMRSDLGRGWWTLDAVFLLVLVVALGVVSYWLSF